MKEIYILNSCNEWKEYSSMNVQGVFTNFKKLQAAIRMLIKEKEFEVEDQKFNKEWDIRQINDNVRYCFIDVRTPNVLD